MDFTIRSVYPYLDVKVDIDSTSIDLGLLDKHERWDLASKLINAASDLTEERSDVYKVLKELGIDQPETEEI